MNAVVYEELVDAGIACIPLIADPKSWINRRVETVEMLSHEETHRRVSVDFTLDDKTMRALTTAEGVVVPISVLTKERRRNFDLRDEAGRAVPVLGKEQNAALAQIALVGAAASALPDMPPERDVNVIVQALSEVVAGSPVEARAALEKLRESANAGDRWRRAILEDDTCLSLLDALWQNYVLFAVLPTEGPTRRVVKYSYGEMFPLRSGWRERMKRALTHPVWRLDREEFVIDCPGAWRARSFHAEVMVPEELRIELAVLYDFSKARQLGDADERVDRASLYASGISDQHAPAVCAVVTPERAGRVELAAFTSVVVAGLLWLGVCSGLDAESPGASVSVLTAGAALVSGLVAVRSEPRLVARIFATTRRWLGAVTLAAIAAAAMLAMEIPGPAPVDEWRVAAGIASIAALRLSLSFFRAPG